MKRFLIIAAGLLLLAVGQVNAQTLDQKKICALKWTLQQTFYNKSEGQQLARVDVTGFKSFSEFQSNELVVKLMKRITDKVDQRRVDNIINAKTDEELASSVPSGGMKEYKADVEKMKSVTPAEEEAPAEEENVAEEDSDSTAGEEAAVTPVEEDSVGEEMTENPEDEWIDEEEGSTSGMGFWGVVLTSVAIYIVLTVCLLLFRHSRRSSSDSNEPSVSLDQYRSERLRLIERIKSVEIELENMKNAQSEKNSGNNSNNNGNNNNNNNNGNVRNVQQSGFENRVQPTVPKSENVTVEKKPEIKVEPVVVPAPVKEEPKATQQELFANKELPSAEVKPIIQPTETPTSIKPRYTQSIMFFPVPVDGTFVNGTEEIQPGKSLYMLRTTDGTNATFTILNTPEAIQTALISLSETVKPVCKILNTVSNPLEIVTEGPGTAVREGDTWKMVTKSVVRLI